MGFFLANDSQDVENRISDFSAVGPKTHTPALPLQDRGLRFYNPGTGRWASRDPIADVAFRLTNRSMARKTKQPNDLLFVGNDPLSHIDPFGLFSSGDTFNLIWPSGATLGSLKILVYHPAPRYLFAILGRAGAAIEIEPTIERRWKACYIFRWRQKSWMYNQNGQYYYMANDGLNRPVNSYVNGTFYDGARQRGDGTEWLESSAAHMGSFLGFSWVKSAVSMTDGPSVDYSVIDSNNSKVTAIFQTEFVAVYPKDVSISSGGMTVWTGTWGYEFDATSHRILDNPAIP